MNFVHSDDDVSRVCREVINAVCEFHSGNRGLKVTDGAQEAYLLGWWQAVTRQAQAVITLSAASYGYESAPLLRSMIEHSVAIAVLAKKPDFWRVLERQRSDRVTAIKKRLNERGYEEWTELNRYGELLDRPSEADNNISGDRLSRFSHQTEELGVYGDVAYFRYQYLTHYSHAGTETAMTFTSPPGCQCHSCQQGQLPLDFPVAEVIAALTLLEIAATYDDLLEEVWSADIQRLEALCEPLRAAYGGAPFDVSRVRA